MNLRKEIIEEILEFCYIDFEIEDSHMLIDDLKFDSLDIIELIMTLEDKYNIDIPDRDVEQVSTVKDIITYIEKRLEN